MKKITFLFLALFATANIYSQTYTISFAGTGAAATVDSVKVENLTQSTTVKWHAGDVLQLQLSNSINEMGVNEQNLQVFPNPMQGQAEILFYAKQTGNATLSIYDIAGKEVLQTEDKLLQGTQKYQLLGLKQGVYFINISGENYFYTGKLISQNATSNETKIKFIGSEKQEAVISTLKSTKATVTMNYTTGNSLRFTGYSGTYSAIVNDVPTASKTINFAFGNTATVTDIDGNVYDTVHIGTQVWLKQNLKVTKYNNGDLIGTTTPATLDISGSTVKKYQWAYEGDESNVAIYGRLYTWVAATDNRKICPNGWHLPSDAEWTTLANYLGGESLAGGKLKEIGTAHWSNPNIGATNETGFTALPGGFRLMGGTFYYKGNMSEWWSSTIDVIMNAFARSINYNNSNLNRSPIDTWIGASVRCLKD